MVVKPSPNTCLAPSTNSVPGAYARSAPGRTGRISDTARIPVLVPAWGVRCVS